MSCPQTYVSATAVTPPPPGPLSVSRTRVRNQRRTTSLVPGFCDGSPHGTSARLRPRLHHRPAPSAPSRRLTAAGCYRVFVETASGARSDRPVLEQVLDQLRPGDTLVVWKLDRLGRSLRHLVDNRHRPRRVRRRVPEPPGGHRHYHPGRQARLPCVRRVGRVRTRPHPRTHGGGWAPPAPFGATGNLPVFPVEVLPDW